MNLSIHIERLVLDGVNIMPGQRELLQAALEAELARLLATDGLSPDLASGGARPSLQAGSIQPASDGNPARLGQQIAQAVYSAIGAPESTRR